MHPRTTSLRVLFASLGAAVTLGLAPACDSDSDADDHGETEGHDDHGDEHDDHGHDDHGHDHNESEIITTVTLTFTPDGGGEPVVASFEDPDGDGGVSGMSDSITLAADTTYTLAVSFSNDLEDPPEDITPEIEEEAEEHQIFVYGSAVQGPATGDAANAILTHTYADMESTYGANAVGDDLPVGLANQIVTGAAGTGDLQIMLRHLPDLDGEPVKVTGLAEELAAGEALPGDVDVDVQFSVTVQ